MADFDFPNEPMRTGAVVSVGRRTDDSGQQLVALTFVESADGDVRIYGLSADEVDFLLGAIQTARATIENPN